MSQTEQPARGSYAPRQPVTEDDKQRIDEALTRTRGHRPHAAILLGISYDRLTNVVLNDPGLRAKWSNTKRELPEGLAGEVHRDPGLSPDEIKAAEGLAKQEALLAKGWDVLGYSEEQRQFLLTLQATYRTSLRATLDLTYGGMMHSYTRLLMLFEDLHKKLAHIDANPAEYMRTHRTEFGENVVKTAHEHRCELYDRFLAVSAELRKVNNDATKVNIVRAQLDKLKADDGGPKRKKAGWSANPAQKVAPIVQGSGAPAAPVVVEVEPEAAVDAESSD